MKLVLTSDWHGELPDDLPEGDVLAIAGDLLPVWDHDLNYQYAWARQRLAPHLASLPHERVLLIGGNHDFLFEADPGWKGCLPAKATYLCDEAVEVGGVSFYGTPWSNKFRDWAFMGDEEFLFERWQQIPDALDVLLVHGPPHGVLDASHVTKGEHVGSCTLRARLDEIAVPVVACGHIHGGYGAEELAGGGTVYNVALMDEGYRPVNPAVVVEVGS